MPDINPKEEAIKERLRLSSNPHLAERPDLEFLWGVFSVLVNEYPTLSTRELTEKAAERLREMGYPFGEK